MTKSGCSPAFGMGREVGWGVVHDHETGSRLLVPGCYSNVCGIKEEHLFSKH